ncbi:MAG: peptide chain release factor N(5)-glutamine methyltransferase [Deltaproteobacteria bacterium]|jgi:release factor glutamine methyltransferase|nr:peptide chain release factor N(5)-glutamine methyltransferase [Deltaproteobacteria bacterium]
MNIIESLQNAETELGNANARTARLDAEVLLAHILDIKRIDLYINHDKELNPEEQCLFKKYIERRKRYEPVAYITGTKEFWSMPVNVTSDVLVPRPETELLVEKVISIIEDSNLNVNILDICTGSGNIPMALATELPNAKITATDISEKAIKLAEQNTSFAKDRIKCKRGDLFNTVSADETFDIITANPPYARPSDKHLFSREVLEYEPESAVFGGTSGLDFIERIIDDGHNHLKAGGWIIFEIGIDQGEEIRNIVGLNKAYDSICIDKDLAGIERIVSIRKKWKNL